MTTQPSGLFVAFEGGDGAGKSTQSQLLADHLTRSGRDVVTTREPGGTDVGAGIRRILLSPETGDLDPRTEVLLYAADRAEHLNRVVRPGLTGGAVVITDRYVDSTFAYQGAGRALPLGEVRDLMTWATGDLVPGLTVLLDLEPSVGLGRFEERDRIEAAGIEFHRRVRQGFLDLAAAAPERYLVLDARDDIETLATRIRVAVEDLLNPSAADSAIRAGLLFEHAVYTTGYHRPDGSPEPVIFEITAVTGDKVFYGPAQHGIDTKATRWIWTRDFDRDALGSWLQ